MAEDQQKLPPSKESMRRISKSRRSSKISEVIKTTELGSLEPKKSALKNQQRKVSAAPPPTPVKEANILLTEDDFGILYDERGLAKKIKRFTWRNHNNIEVQVITYGARITSIKLPNRKGVVDDVVLGFPNLAGYLQYGNYYFGAIIGRMTNKIERSTFEVDGKQYWLSANDGKNHLNGGNKGFDKVVWEPYVCDNKLVLSHTSPHGHEGFPGDLLVRITFELTAKNEFRINMEAVTTAITIVNLSNLTYFNLAGHQAGPEELYRHMVTINSNCYTLTRDDGLPSGEINNAVYTKFDFQIPTVLKTCLCIEPNDGYDQNFCVNRGMDQENCFIARALHTPSGRILEIYSNQCGVNFTTANNFGSGLIANNFGSSLMNIPTNFSESAKHPEEEEENIFTLLNTIHEKVNECPENGDNKGNLEEIRGLVQRIKNCKLECHQDDFDLNVVNSIEMSHPDFEIASIIKPIGLQYLRRIRRIASSVTSITSYSELHKVVAAILETTEAMDKVSSLLVDDTKIGQSSTSSSEKILKSELLDATEGSEQGSKKMDVGSRNPEDRASEVERIRKATTREVNVIPSYYKDGRIHGKNGAIYKRHSAIAFQTQNYPNAIYHQNFPNCILKPGETYRHTIVYRFWLLSGKPTLFNKRNCL